MRARKIIVGAMGLISCCIAMADVYIDSGSNVEDGVTYWIHEDSILDLDNGTTSFYLYAANINPKLPYDLMVAEMMFRCKSREAKIIESISFLKGEQKSTDKTKGEWQRARPHSFGDRWRQIICDKKERDKAFHYSFASENELRIASQGALHAMRNKAKAQSQPPKSEPKKNSPKQKKSSSDLDLL